MASSGDEDDHLLPAGRNGHHDDDDDDGSSGTAKAAVELPGRVAQWYYKHGLFLSSYPTCATSIAIVVVLLSW